MKDVNTLDTYENLKQDNEYVLLKFHVTWCQPCKNFAPIVDRVADTRTDVTFAAVDIDKLPEVRETLNVRSVPTLILLKNGEKLDALSGSGNNANVVNDWIDHAMSA
jgi:thioredoxin